MANIRSAEKDIRKTTARTAHNQTVKSRIRTLRKKVVAAIEKKDAAAAAASLSEFASAADKAALEKAVDEAIAFVESSASASKDEYESHQKELESIANPIMSKLYGGQPGGMPDFGASAGGAAPNGGSDQGPTIEEVD